jgi:DNA-binding transcriptional ArsR family regulator
MTETLLEFFKAMAHDSRLRIVGLLAQRRAQRAGAGAALGLKEPTVSHHLAILKAQGIVTARADGTTRWHALDRDALERWRSACCSRRREARRAAPSPTTRMPRC